MSNTNIKARGRFHGKKAKIKVIGVGGGGGNAINRMVNAGIESVDFLALNTDAQDLRRNLASWRVQLGETLARGLGVGGDPEKGRLSAEESIEHIRQIVSDTDLLFITAGMGGGTGTGAAPVVARVAREVAGDDVLVIGVVTRPFAYEGQTRMKQAEEGIAQMRNYADSMLIIPNEKLFDIIDRDTPTKDAYQMADDVLRQAIQGISEVITTPGEVNVDFNDIKRIMAKSGEALIGIGETSGTNRHIEAARKAITSPLLENADLEGAKGLIVHFLARDHMTYEQREVVEFIKENASKDAMIKYGLVYDESMEDKLRVTVIATGFSRAGSGGLRPNPRKRRLPMTPGFDEPPREEYDDASIQDDMLIPAFMRRKKSR
ncbi:MAG: cell division protein FtsZ [Elusimicrobiales bacterium]|nr:cell division protein FtsZ [Elusimicrobiales bacterium]